MDSHDVTEIHLTQRINICDLLLKHNKNLLFLKHVITGDEKWVLYSNVSRKKRSWSKPGESAQVACKRHNHQKMFGYQFGGIARDPFITKLYQSTRRLIQMSTFSN